MKLNILIKKPLKNYKVGDIVPIIVDSNNIPLDIYWRKRLQDSKVDGCLEIICQRDQETSSDNIKMKYNKKGKKIQTVTQF